VSQIIAGLNILGLFALVESECFVSPLRPEGGSSIAIALLSSRKEFDQDVAGLSIEF
jgi:hypothetical protein